MAVKEFLNFESFWTAISKSVQDHNHPTFHPCCGVWVGRFQKIRRESHCKKIAWGDAIRSIKSSETNLKTLLHAHMVEHQWGPPIRLDAPCTSRISLSELNQLLAHRPLGSEIQAGSNPTPIQSLITIPASPISAVTDLNQITRVAGGSKFKSPTIPDLQLDTESKSCNHR